jgi:hypothetical protein
MTLVGRTGLSLALVLIAATTASAEDDLAKRWPSVPKDTLPPLEDVMIDNLSDIGNRFGDHLDELSHDLIGLHVDGRGQRARLRVGGGNPHYLTFKLDSDWLFSEGKARVNAHLELGLAGHVLDLKLPAMDLSQDNYHGVQLVQVNVPLLERRF